MEKNETLELLKFDKDVLTLALHETAVSEMCWGLRVRVLRVPNGWLYQYLSREMHNNGDGYDEVQPPVFVPISII